MVITLGEDVNGENVFFDVDVSGFRFVSFHSKTDRSATLFFRFSTQEGNFNDVIPRTNSFGCNIASSGANCQTNDGVPFHSFRVAGPFLLVQLVDAQNTTVQVFLSR